MIILYMQKNDKGEKMKKSFEDQLEELLSDWDNSQKAKCPACDTPLTTDRGRDQMWEMGREDFEKDGYVSAVVLTCPTASDHETYCFQGEYDDFTYEDNCGLDSGDSDHRGWRLPRVCHETNSWFDVTDFRFSGKDKKPRCADDGVLRLE